LQIKTKIVSCHTADSKPVKQEVNGTVILPPLVFPGCAHMMAPHALQNQNHNKNIASPPRSTFIVVTHSGNLFNWSFIIFLRF
jgi:hypothetical protein